MKSFRFKKMKEKKDLKDFKDDESCVIYTPDSKT